MNGFSLKQGQGVKAWAAHLHQNCPQVPPPPPMPPPPLNQAEMYLIKADVQRNALSSLFIIKELPDQELPTRI